MAPEGHKAPARLGARGAVFLLLLVAAGACALQLGLSPADLWPSQGGLSLASDFFAAALRPALDYQATDLPAETPPFSSQVLWAAWRTVRFAAAAIGLSVLIGIPLGFLASSAWWSDEIVAHARSPFLRLLRRTVAPVIYGLARMVIAFLRSIHELLWAILFMVALGLNDVTGVVAIALPYSGILAKIISEMIDEAPRDAARAMRQSGATPLQVFTFGLLPGALPDILAYIFYRFECGLRASAVLGFFGIETLGYRIKLSFEELYFGEVWTHLYVLLLLILAADWWSGAMRRRFVA